MIHQHEEPYEGRLSRTVLWEDWGEIPLSDPISGKAMTTQPDRQIEFFLIFHILVVA